VADALPANGLAALDLHCDEGPGGLGQLAHRTSGEVLRHAHTLITAGSIVVTSVSCAVSTIRWWRH
jgi:hypothetical protein